MYSIFTKKHTHRGFTLIELLVVIAIIGILSSVVLASLNTARLKSRDTRRISDIKQIQLALALYFDSNSAYPATLTPLVTQGLLPVVPEDPSTGDPYVYVCLGSGTAGNNYHLGAILEDTDNPALDSDRDGTAGASICTGSNPSADFLGTAADCEGTTATTDECYDQKP